MPEPKTSFKRLFAECVKEHGRFGHAAHIHLAWRLLEERPALDALATFNAGLLALAQELGLTDKYNATLTTAYFLLLLERKEPGQDWPTFAARHPDVLDWEGRAHLLGPFYPAGWDSAEARQGFVMPHVPE